MSSLEEFGRERKRMTELLGAKSGFSVGICASGRAENLSNLVKLVMSERLPLGFSLRKLVVVASGCDRTSIERLKSEASRCPGVVEVVEESERRGKAEAINEIVDRAIGDYLVFVNADAIPRPGSIGFLLRAISSDARAGMISGRPTFAGGRGVTSNLLRLMWAVHNDCSLRLNHMSMSNHSTDELMVVRRGLLPKLPPEVVNDGAYIAGSAKLKGYRIKFCEGAPVEIDVPERITDILAQRRRILFGHLQVWRLTGSAPRTVESLMLISPLLGLGVAVRTLARFPRLIRAIPVAIVSEAISAFFALSDLARRSDRHRVWKRYAG